MAVQLAFKSIDKDGVVVSFSFGFLLIAFLLYPPSPASVQAKMTAREERIFASGIFYRTVPSISQ